MGWGWRSIWRSSPAYDGEVLGLRWSDLDLENGVVRVGQELMIERGRARLKPVPERERRTVSVPSSVVRMLLEHRHRQHDERAMNGPAPHDDDLVFRAPGGGWLTPDRFARVMSDLIEQSRVPRITPNERRRAGPLLAHRHPGPSNQPV